MNISISSALDKIGLKKAPKMVAQEPLDEAGKFLLGRNVFGSPAEPVRSAKASAAFFNAQGMMTKANGEPIKEAVSGSKVKNIFNSVKNSKVGQKTSSAFAYVKNNKVTTATKETLNSVSNSTKSFFSKPVVKKGLKYAGIAALAFGVLYLGKKAYDYYQNHKAAPAASGSVDVKEGDNVWNIAKKDLGGKATDAEIAKRTEELMKLNNLEYANDKGLVIIKPGDKIKLA
jgi:hypothetical protein